MNHLRTYIRLVRVAENRTPPDGYTERHHVFPTSIFGENSRTVMLSAREHWVAHLLLLHIVMKRYGRNHWKTVKMALAIQAMSMKSTFTNGREISTSHMYSLARNVWAQGVSGENHWTVVQGRECPFIALNKDPEVAARRGENNSRILREKAERGEHIWQDEEWLRKRNEDPEFVQRMSDNGKKGRGKHWYRNPKTGEQTKAFTLPSGTGWEPGRLSFSHKGKS